jgi:cytoskeletal protein RodZ
MEDNSRDIPSSSPASSGSIRESKLFRGLIAGVLVGVLVLGAAYYLHFSREEAASERTPPPTSTAEAPASQPSAPDQRAPAPNAPAEQAKAAPAPPAPSPNEQTASPATPAPGVPTQGPATDQPATDQPAKPRDQPNPNDAATRPDQPNPSDRATKPDSAPAAPLQDQAASLPAAEVVFVQRPRVKIRSAPNAHAKVLGSATKGQQFTVTRRAGRWVQIDTGNGRGWISASLLGSQSP